MLKQLTAEEISELVSKAIPKHLYFTETGAGYAVFYCLMLDMAREHLSEAQTACFMLDLLKYSVSMNLIQYLLTYLLESGEKFFLTSPASFIEELLELQKRMLGLDDLVSKLLDKIAEADESVVLP